MLSMNRLQEKVRGTLGLRGFHNGFLQLQMLVYGGSNNL